MDYDSSDSRNGRGALVLFGIVILIGALVYFGGRYFGGGTPAAPGEEGPVAEEEVETVTPPGTRRMPEAPKESPPETAEEALATIGIGITAADPGLLVEQIGRNLEAGEVQAAANLIGRQAISDRQMKRLHELAAKSRLKLNVTRPVTEIGELEINKRARWALNLMGDRDSRIYFDLARGKRGWGVEKVTLPPERVDDSPPRAVLVDALAITDAFLHATLGQNFETAKSFVDSSEVSDAKIAGLCIVFEEGDYELRPRRPLRALFNRDNTAAFIAHVQTPSGEQAAEFGVNVQRDGPESPWRVTEINLDKLLADYAERVAGGDVYLTPLIRNPKGGDTLILYFGFDVGGLTPRTERQLQIVSLLLQTDPGKRLTISGHTDAIGSENYNQGLSLRRAEAVRQFLIDEGVTPEQIETLALGKSKPRRPNTTETGEDNPLGRRVNRRTEIYLDF